LSEPTRVEHPGFRKIVAFRGIDWPLLCVPKQGIEPFGSLSPIKSMRLHFSTVHKWRHSPAIHSTRKARALSVGLTFVFLLAGPLRAADLQPAASAGFDRYAKLTQDGFDSENKNLGSFLWMDGLSQDQQRAHYAQLQAGQVVIEHLATLDRGSPIVTPGALIHHWVGTVFVPEATLAQVLAFEQDYDHQQPYFMPDVMRSKILSRNGPDFTVELRFYKKKVISVVLETQHQVHYEQLDATHAWSRSWTTRVQQVDHPGQPNESLEPEGHDDGFLWRMDTYWRFEQKDGGVYIESQSISLTRDVPAGLSWLIGPYITSIPRESLTFTLAATRKAIVARRAANSSR
jgi:hypothetical protein